MSWSALAGPGRLLLTLLLAAALASACGGSDTRPASGEVVLYTSMPDAVVDRLEGVIEQRFPDLAGNYWAPIGGEGISLTVVRGRTADIQQRIQDEIEGGGLRPDLIWLAEPSPYEGYKRQDLLARYELPAEAPIAAEYVDADGFYVAGRIISMLLAWNTQLRPEGLNDWPDLATSEPASFPAPASGAARATIMALVGKYGWDYFSGFAAAGGTSVASNGAARDAVSAGAVEAVAVLDYMARQAKSDGFPVDFRFPAGGTVLIPSPIAITADAPNPTAARAVVDFILSQSGQRIMVEIGNFYPVRDDVAPPSGAPPLVEIEALAMDWAQLAVEIDEIGVRWDDLFGSAPAP